MLPITVFACLLPPAPPVPAVPAGATASCPADLPTVNLADLVAFPGRVEVTTQRNLADAHDDWVREGCSSRRPWPQACDFGPRCAWPAGTDWDEWRADARSRWLTWEELYEATDPAAGGAAKCYHLEALRRRIGAEAYYRGRMPDPVPLSRYREMK